LPLMKRTVSQWGHDFRPEYLKLSFLKDRFANIPLLALTATVDGPTRKDIIERLDLKEGRLFISGFDRPNIKYSIFSKDNSKHKLLKFIEDNHLGDSEIVYCLSRARVEATAKWLTEEGFKVCITMAEWNNSIAKRIRISS
jgi:ATP-dependent DNA helicase RecQ